MAKAATVKNKANSCRRPPPGGTGPEETAVAQPPSVVSQRTTPEGGVAHVCSGDPETPDGVTRSMPH